MPRNPARVLITGGAAGGGIASFAEALRAGFEELEIPAEVVAPSGILGRWRGLRDCETLKILSTTAVFAAPLARRTICVAHGFPRADMQGWPKMLGIAASYKLANSCALLAAVSHYAALHLRGIFNLRVDAVIHNPLDSVFQQLPPAREPRRDCITYVGRLHPAKRLDQIFPAVLSLIEQVPELRVCIIGDGPLRRALQAAAGGHPRIEFTGCLPREQVCARLRRTRVFVSGCETEALGIAYLEALSQGCVVVMPACGGGLEIAPREIGGAIRLLPLPLEQHAILGVLREALSAQGRPQGLAEYSGAAVARAYLDLDRHHQSAHVAVAPSAAVQG